MKKLVFLLMIIIACIFIAGCVFDNVHYCPYCGSANIEELDNGNFKCGNSSCGKTFGAKGL